MAQCKEKMRPVKKSLKGMQRLPERGDSEGWDDATRAARLNEVSIVAVRLALLL